jgi:hypothetical protein
VQSSASMAAFKRTVRCEKSGTGVGVVTLA